MWSIMKPRKRSCRKMAASSQKHAGISAGHGMLSWSKNLRFAVAVGVEVLKANMVNLFLMNREDGHSFLNLQSSVRLV